MKHADSSLIGSSWRHYKGGVYRIITPAINEADHEEVVVYEDANDPNKRWVRPTRSFTEEVTDAKGNKVLRFEPID